MQSARMVYTVISVKKLVFSEGSNTYKVQDVLGDINKDDKGDLS